MSCNAVSFLQHQHGGHRSQYDQAIARRSEGIRTDDGVCEIDRKFVPAVVIDDEKLT